jgi:hypothetical protein
MHATEDLEDLGLEDGVAPSAEPLVTRWTDIYSRSIDAEINVGGRLRLLEGGSGLAGGAIEPEL